MKKTIALILTAALPSLLLAQFDNAGTSAASFLKIGVGGRGIALAGSQVASVNDASALYWNPAGTANLRKGQVMFSNTSWIADTKHNFLAVAYPIEDIATIGLSINYLSMGEMKVTTWDKTDGTGETFTAYGTAIGLGLSRRLSDRFMVGAQVKYVQESISNSSASTVALDVGSQYDIRWLRIGFSILNFGPELRLSGRDQMLRVDPFPTVGANPDDVVAALETQSWSLPILFQLGFAVTPFHDDFWRLTFTFDYRDERDYKPQTLSGVEIGISEMFFLRAGVRNRLYSDINNAGAVENKDFYLLNAGFGAALNIPGTEYTVRFDYAYQQMKFFDNTQVVTLYLDF